MLFFFYLSLCRYLHTHIFHHTHKHNAYTQVNTHTCMQWVRTLKTSWPSVWRRSHSSTVYACNQAINSAQIQRGNMTGKLANRMPPVHTPEVKTQNLQALCSFIVLSSIFFFLFLYFFLFFPLRLYVVASGFQIIFFHFFSLTLGFHLSSMSKKKQQTHKLYKPNANVSVTSWYISISHPFPHSLKRINNKNNINDKTYFVIVFLLE